MGDNKGIAVTVTGLDGWVYKGVMEMRVIEMLSHL